MLMNPQLQWDHLTKIQLIMNHWGKIKWRICILYMIILIWNLMIVIILRMKSRTIWRQAKTTRSNTRRKPNRLRIRDLFKVMLYLWKNLSQEVKRRHQVEMMSMMDSGTLREKVILTNSIYKTFLWEKNSNSNGSNQGR